MAALPKPSSWIHPSTPIQVVKRPQQLEFSGVFRGHELTRKDRRLSSGLAPLDALIDGGIPRGRISEITGRAGSGKTSLAASFAALGAFDPESMSAAGVELHRMLWASTRRGSKESPNPARNLCSPLQKG